jgi:hypothetical protein
LDPIHTSGQAKITDLDTAVLVDKDIGWLQVSVKDLSRMTVLQGNQNPISDGIDVKKLEVKRGLDQLFDVALAVFQNNIKGVEVLLVLRNKHIDDIDHIRVLHHLQKNQFSDDSLAVHQVVEETVDFLDGHFPPRFILDTLRHEAVGPLPQLLHQSVLRPYFPIGKVLGRKVDFRLSHLNSKFIIRFTSNITPNSTSTFLLFQRSASNSDLR